MALSSQGFLSDLLKKANRPYDEAKLQEYTQTIVCGSQWGRWAWAHVAFWTSMVPWLQQEGGMGRGVTRSRFCPNSCGCLT